MISLPIGNWRITTGNPISQAVTHSLDALGTNWTPESPSITLAI
jgi:hypothetical protein